MKTSMLDLEDPSFAGPQTGPQFSQCRGVMVLTCLVLYVCMDAVGGQHRLRSLWRHYYKDNVSPKDGRSEVVLVLEGDRQSCISVRLRLSQDSHSLSLDVE